MPAGRELDALVAQYVLGHKLCTGDQAIVLTNKAFPDRPGWETWYIDDWHILEDPIPDAGLERLPYYSTDIAAAWQIAEKLRLCLIPRVDGGWNALPWEDVRGSGPLPASAGSAHTAPLAICHAVLKTVEKLRTDGVAEAAI